MVQNTSSGTKPLRFSNWDMKPMTIDDCVVFTSNGFWDSKNKLFCPRIKTCPVCSFNSVPKLTMKGLCPECTLDYYWYLARDKSHEVFYDGYKEYKIFPSDDFRTWNVSVPADESMTYNMELFNGPGTPIGHNFWNTSDSFCNSNSGTKDEIGLSTCKLGRDFTCNSGECISKYKRCDGVYDCRDHSDEENCKLILVPPIYDKSKLKFSLCSLKILFC